MIMTDVKERMIRRGGSAASGGNGDGGEEYVTLSHSENGTVEGTRQLLQLKSAHIVVDKRLDSSVDASMSTIWLLVLYRRGALTSCTW